jgi:uncharacterized protein with GYD domain
MPIFIVLCKFESGVDLTTLDFEPEATAGKLMQKVGGSVKDLWLTGGEFDMVAVVDAPDTGKAITFLMAFSSLGRVRTMTLTATDDVDKTVQDAKDAKTDIGGGNGDAKTDIGGGGNGGGG